MEIYERVKDARKSLGMTQEAFGEGLGMSRSMVVNLEMNKLKNDDQIRRYCKIISKAYGVNETWLLTGDGEMMEPLSREAELAQIAAQLFNDSDPDAEMRKQLFELIKGMGKKELEVTMIVRDYVVNFFSSEEEE